MAEEKGGLRKLLLRSKQFAKRWRQKTIDAREKRKQTIVRTQSFLEENKNEDSGDISMYTTKMQIKREKLRSSRKVIQALDRWWVACLISSDSNKLVMPKKQYMEFHKRLSNSFKKGAISSKAPTYDRRRSRRRSITSLETLGQLSSSFSQQIEAAVEGSTGRQTVRDPGNAKKAEIEEDATAEEDWERDSMGTGSVSRSRFHRSLFELADIWCDDAREEDYEMFLNTLHQRCFPTLGVTMEKLDAMVKVLNKSSRRRGGLRGLNRTDSLADMLRERVDDSDYDSSSDSDGDEPVEEIKNVEQDLLEESEALLRASTPESPLTVEGEMSPWGESESDGGRRTSASEPSNKAASIFASKAKPDPEPKAAGECKDDSNGREMCSNICHFPAFSPTLPRGFTPPYEEICVKKKDARDIVKEYANSAAFKERPFSVIEAASRSAAERCCAFNVRRVNSILARHNLAHIILPPGLAQRVPRKRLMHHSETKTRQKISYPVHQQDAANIASSSISFGSSWSPPPSQWRRSPVPPPLRSSPNSSPRRVVPSKNTQKERSFLDCFRLNMRDQK